MTPTVDLPAVPCRHWTAVPEHLVDAEARATRELLEHRDERRDERVRPYVPHAHLRRPFLTDFREVTLPGTAGKLAGTPPVLSGVPRASSTIERYGAGALSGHAGAAARYRKP